ncbi:MaoC family dehydratase [Rhodococcus tukisamuensis]|uniref:Acyl dehydratase n=1 Tax=Rhodococcus tukisamuensis TaxID=168276 RepID=A0A1G6QE22_9NOCA|nr:MaoC family dehydratase [Rhodococcus tukisamuensis]SDC90752.1 Acyl dehydratase [Rhodococcus tukisamuensis]
MTTTVGYPTHLIDLAGMDLGTTDWYTITQEQVNGFADATGDHQWIHTDPARAAAGPFRGTIAHGYLTLALASRAIAELLAIENLQAAVNYGLNKVRFPAPVPVGSKVRASARVVSAWQRDAGVEAVLDVTFEVEGSPRPACVAECVVIYR